MKKILIETQLFKATPLSLVEGKLSDRGNPMVEGILATAEVKKMVMVVTTLKNYGNGKLKYHGI
jgi:hypothetical protein